MTSSKWTVPSVPVYTRGSVTSPGSPMPGLMQDRPLLIQSLLQFAETNHPRRRVVARLPECPQRLHRYTFLELAERTRRLANVLVSQLSIGMGDVVASMATNTHRHLELYYAVSGMGAVLHTVNPRLFPQQIEWMLNHAAASVVFVDFAFVSVLQTLVQRGTMRCRRFVLMMGEESMPASLPFPVSCYETLLSASSSSFTWPTFCESAASLICYTSGTTGNPKCAVDISWPSCCCRCSTLPSSSSPLSLSLSLSLCLSVCLSVSVRGVLFTHRSTLLHAMAVAQADSLGMSSHDVVLCCIPFCHVSGWGFPYAALLVGAALVLPGAGMDVLSLMELLQTERCTLTGGVPTLWLAVLHHLDEHAQLRLPELRRVVVGGSAAPPSMIQRFGSRGILCLHCWGMTEMSPIGTVGRLLPEQAELTPEQQSCIRQKQGRPPFGVEMKTVDEQGRELPRDGQSRGDLLVRGPWITRGYFRVDRQGGEAGSWAAQVNVDEEGWFSTGDVATLDQSGFMQIVDRSKDVIKSGGEWVSSIDLENAAVGHPAVAEAAVIGVRHSKWQERPLLLLVRKAGAAQQASEQDVIAWLSERVVKWWLPEAIVFVDDIPHTATGKIMKTELRKRYATYRFPSDVAGAQETEETDVTCKPQPQPQPQPQQQTAAAASPSIRAAL